MSSHEELNLKYRLVGFAVLVGALAGGVVGLSVGILKLGDDWSSLSELTLLGALLGGACFGALRGFLEMIDE
jgi:hypothetical protein